jgi:hypothetical protein
MGYLLSHRFFSRAVSSRLDTADAHDGSPVSYGHQLERLFYTALSRSTWSP